VNTEDFASLIMTGKPVIVEKTDERVNHLAQMCKDIWDMPSKKRHRNPQQVFDDCLNVVLEMALPVIDPRFELNPKTFDHTDPDSYNYDVRFNTGDIVYRFELKRMRQAATKWHTYSVKNLKTFFKNFRSVNFVLSGKVFNHANHWEVGYHLLTPAKTYLPDDEMLEWMSTRPEFDSLLISSMSQVDDRSRCLKQTMYASPERPWTYYNVFFDLRKGKKRCVHLEDFDVQYTVQ
jgi:hypothetical protein